MTLTSNIAVSEIVNSDSALTPKAGDLVFERIVDSLGHKQKTVVSFDGIRFMTTAFLNAAIGQLYSKFHSEFLNQYLEIAISEADMPLLQRVLTNARLYFSDKQNIDDPMSDL